MLLLNTALVSSDGLKRECFFKKQLILSLLKIKEIKEGLCNVYMYDKGHLSN